MVMAVIATAAHFVDTVGDVIHFGGLGLAAKKGLFIVVTGTVNVLYS